MQAGWAVGYMLAALLAAAVLPGYGWRALFLLGVLPAFFTLWIQRHVPEPEIWEAGKKPAGAAPAGSLREIALGPLWRRTALASLLTTSVLFAYWGLFTWMPSFLARPAEQGGAGLGLVKSSAWMVPMQIGAFCGYTLFGFLADRHGRRPVFIAFLLMAALIVPLYGQLARSELMLLLLGPLVGFFGHGYFSVFGALLAELFPTRIRGTAQGFTYNVGRAFGAAAPYTIGFLGDRYGLGSALALTAAFFLAGAALMLALPETKGKELH
jgi:MFS family permease